MSESPNQPEPSAGSAEPTPDRTEQSKADAGAAWRRRAITVPLYVAAFALWLAATPIWVPLAAIVDLVRRNGGVALRSGAMLAAYLGCETVGMLAAGGVWLWRKLFGLSDEAWEKVHFDLEAAWGTALFRAMVVLFGLKVEMEGEQEADLGRGPYLLMPRHASTGDTVLAAALISRPHDMHLRYILKQEHMWDPCLDIVGHRVPNVFVDRESDDSRAEVRRVQTLAHDLGPKDGVLIYPEGTRFSLAKQSRVLERLAQAGDPKMIDYARSLAFVLPPKAGGPLGLMDVAPDVDVVFCAHVGFEGTASLADIWNGSLLNRVIRLCFWRVPASEIPPAGQARHEWLLEQWRRVGAWVEAEHREGVS